ncbi:GNAT family N-acetyltransferase [Malaciobacter molluscorum LMG 25693]|uniref:Acetyltransferase (GNAT family) n=1 Tax=Malaciobacter molluscorum LMG 25693 TaxID=870501 RepID=A0A2G1DJ11_9BACT|nr:GNAT family N-acetyltransferase [Malaciobacter molluscorum]AXX91924.1 acetyltransferase (GNAT family) [Malaciobacter molluscorum LMG 25693]PHO18326.1 GNAT family N-acetyltransferase [Malaciobacter molluscorum LMG 25693]RXJ94209.1 GNAT family N-acetyltransferase [Malaciobacter molluscorum]
MSKVIIRDANIDDSETIFNFIKELAIYEKALDEVKTNVEGIKQSVFGENSVTYVLIAEYNNEPVGMALYFYNYSTWEGKNGIYLEDLFVTDKYRGIGAGKALLKQLAKIAVEKDCKRVEWQVLDWNKPSIDFYDSIGANGLTEWIPYRLTGDALIEFAKN